MTRLPWILLAACGTASTVPSVRFANAPPVAIVDDRQDVPEPPAARWFGEYLYHYEGVFERRITRAMELPRSRRALGINAFDEVPDSTWFTNRIGQHDLTLDELRSGPAQIDSPELHKPWIVKKLKEGGTEVGFIISDARGIKFLIKFDPRGLPEHETAAHVIVGHLLWACGYNVTEDFVVKFRREDLVVAPGFDVAKLDAGLARIEIDSDGQIRAMASRWLAGTPLGGFPAEGVREDDPNDRIPHELRRDLRGAQPIVAWLDHVDLQESNFLDMWTADPRDPKRHYVKHYMIDFGKALGVMNTTESSVRHGFEYVVDFATMTRSLVTAGLVRRPWEGRPKPPLRGVAMYDADTFDPGSWVPDFPSYRPIFTADRIDKFWGAKIMMRLTRPQIHAIVETGRLSDPAATEYLTDTLVARQRATGEYWFSRVNPLDRFTMTNGQLCFDDLLLTYELGSTAADTRYAISLYDEHHRDLGAASQLRPDPRGHACFALSLSRGPDGYTIVRITTTRPGFSGSTFVHVARDPKTTTPRVIGIWRP